MNIGQAIDELVFYSKECGLIDERDSAYAVNMLLDALSLTEHTAGEPTGKYTLSEILGAICDYAAEVGIIENNSVVYRDLFDTRIMGLLTPRPSEVIRRFDELYACDPAKATDYFYALCRNSVLVSLEEISELTEVAHLNLYGSKATFRVAEGHKGFSL